LEKQLLADEITIVLIFKESSGQWWADVGNTGDNFSGV